MMKFQRTSSLDFTDAEWKFVEPITRGLKPPPLVNPKREDISMFLDLASKLLNDLNAQLDEMNEILFKEVIAPEIVGCLSVISFGEYDMDQVAEELVDKLEVQTWFEKPLVKHVLIPIIRNVAPLKGPEIWDLWKFSVPLISPTQGLAAAYGAMA